MTIDEFCRLSLSGENIILCDCTNNPENIYNGSILDLLRNSNFSNTITNEISSWDIENGILCLNYVKEDL